MPLPDSLRLFVGAAAAQSSSFPERIALDAYEAGNDGAAGPVSTTAALQTGEWYDVRISGTFTVWTATSWCGTPEPYPMEPSPGVATGGVGVDADTVFAAATGSSTCASGPLPRHTGILQANLGSGFAHIEPVGGALSTPTAGHSYVYKVQGQGQPLQFRIPDTTTSDNYGVLTIVVAPTGQLPAHQTVWLDAHSPTDDGDAGPVSGAGTLESGRWYDVRIEGTYSKWTATSWCGAPEAAPLYPSPAVSNGSVTDDADTAFAGKDGGSWCASIPGHRTYLQMDLGSGFAHVEPISGPFSSAEPDHVYAYRVLGQGKPIWFRVLDDPVSDNYGRLEITITPTPFVGRSKGAMS